MRQRLIQTMSGQETVPRALAAAEKQRNDLLPAAALSGGKGG